MRVCTHGASSPVASIAPLPTSKLLISGTFWELYKIVLLLESCRVFSCVFVCCRVLSCVTVCCRVLPCVVVLCMFRKKNSFQKLMLPIANPPTAKAVGAALMANWRGSSTGRGARHVYVPAIRCTSRQKGGPAAAVNQTPGGSRTARREDVADAESAQIRPRRRKSAPRREKTGPERPSDGFAKPNRYLGCLLTTADGLTTQERRTAP